MIVETNEIVVKNSFKNIQLDLNTYKKINQDLVSKYNLGVELLSKKSTAVNFPFILETYLETLLETTELNTIASFVSDSNPFVPYQEEEVTIIDVVINDDEEEVEEEEEVIIETQTFSYAFPRGWSFFSVPLDLTQVVMTHNYMEGKSIGDVVDFTQLGIDEFIKNHFYLNDSNIPLFYMNLSLYIEVVFAIKNTAGAVYKPEWNFNGIGNISQYEGYQIKSVTPYNNTLNQYGTLHFKMKSILSNSINNLTLTNQTYNNGWYFIGFKSISTNVPAIEYIQDYIDQDKIVIMKNSSAAVVLHEWNFNGIGNLVPGEGYQIKFKNM